MALSISDVPRVTVDVYLMNERARPSGDRHEYLDGLVYAMAGESEAHGTICMNLAAALVMQLRGGPCRAFSKDMRVRCGPHHPGTHAGFYAYPDLVVVCGERRYHDQERDVLLNPTVLIEVLSPSTETFDRGEKFDRYRSWLATLTDYVLVAQDRPLIDHYHRQEDGTWVLRALEGLQAALHLGTIGCTVPLAEMYDRLVFPHAEEAP
jgi:Uma2 family endonuclease